MLGFRRITDEVLFHGNRMARSQLGVRMKQIRPTSSDIRHVALRARYAELLRLRAFVKRIEDSTGGDDVDIKLEKRVIVHL
jgi:hypothetical protein